MKITREYWASYLLVVLSAIGIGIGLLTRNWPAAAWATAATFNACLTLGWRKSSCEWRLMYLRARDLAERAYWGERLQ